MLIMKVQTFGTDENLSNTNVQKYVNCHDAASDRRKPARHDRMYLGLCQVRHHRSYCQWCVRLHSRIYM